MLAAAHALGHLVHGQRSVRGRLVQLACHARRARQSLVALAGQRHKRRRVT